MSNPSESVEPWNHHIGPLTHELRQDVSAVLHQVELSRISDLDETARRRSLGAIEESAENLMVFVDDLVRLGRVARGDVAVNRRTVDLDDLISALGRDRARRIRWGAPLEGSAWTIFTDPLVVDQIVAGLLDRDDRDDDDAVVTAFALRSTDGGIDVVFTSDGSRPIDSALFRSPTLDDGLSVYLAQRMAELIGADVGVLRSGRRDGHLLRLPEAPSPRRTDQRTSADRQTGGSSRSITPRRWARITASRALWAPNFWKIALM